VLSKPSFKSKIDSDGVSSINKGALQFLTFVLNCSIRVFPARYAILEDKPVSDEIRVINSDAISSEMEYWHSITIAILRAIDTNLPIAGLGDMIIKSLGCQPEVIYLTFKTCSHAIIPPGAISLLFSL
jgi:hypothetical protein